MQDAKKSHGRGPKLTCTAGLGKAQTRLPKRPFVRPFRMWSLRIHRLATLVRKLDGTPKENREGTEQSLILYA